MKIISMVAVFFLLFGFEKLKAQAIQPLDTSNLPVMIFESDVINYGGIEYGSNGTREFTFKNTGKYPLIIMEVHSSCGCVVPNYPKDPIKPGGSGIIKILYNTRRVGIFEKCLTITSNSKTPTKQIRIKGVVLPPK